MKFPLLFDAARKKTPGASKTKKKLIKKTKEKELRPELSR
jgi:hypothetical protein